MAHVCIQDQLRDQFTPQPSMALLGTSKSADPRGQSRNNTIDEETIIIDDPASPPPLVFHINPSLNISQICIHTH